MTNRKPPQGPPPIPPLESYRPAEERTGDPLWADQHPEAARRLSHQEHGAHTHEPQWSHAHPNPAHAPFGHDPFAHAPSTEPWPPAPEPTYETDPYAQPPYPQQPHPQQPYGEPGYAEQGYAPPPYEPAFAYPPQPPAYAQQAMPPNVPHAPGPGGPGGYGHGGMGPPSGAPPHHPPQRRRAAPKKRGGFGFLRGLFLVVFALVAIAVGGAAYFLYALPPDFVRDQIVDQVKAKTGRTLTIAGPTAFTIYPSVGFTMKGVTLSPPPGMSGKPLATMDGLDASVALLPLLKREIKVERLVLQKPVFELYTDGKGRKSWEFASLAPAPAVRLAQAAKPLSDAPGGLPSDAEPAAAPASGSLSPAPAATSPASIKSLEQLQLGDVRIVDGTVRYADATAGSVQEASQINVRLGLPAIQKPLAANGNLVWKGEKIDFASEMTSVKAVLEDRPAKLVLDMKAAPITARFDGTVTVRDPLDIDGAITAKSGSVRALAAWLGTALPPAQGFGALEAKGQLRAGGKTVTLSNADVMLDGAKATGQISVETGPERPYVKANLQLSELDLNKYMRPEGTPPQAVTPASGPAPAEPKKPAAKAPPAQSIEDLLNQDAAERATKVHGYEQREGWSSEPIDFTSFGLVDADAKLSLGRLLFQNLKIGQSQLTVALKNRVMKASFDEIQLYNGRGRGFITLDASPVKTASVGANMTVEGLDAEPFLKDAARFDKISGKAKLSIAVAGQGATQLQLVETLNGKSDIRFTDGAVKGINVPGMVRGISQGKLTGLGTSPSEKTDFSELGASWTIANGVAQNQDLSMVSPLLRLTGAGTVALPQRQVDYMMRPKLVSNLAGQGGTHEETGLEIPVHVQGTFDKLSYTPDLNGILKDPNKALDTVKKIGEQFKGKKAGEIVNDLLGGGNGGQQSGSGAADGQPKTDAKSLLNQFLNKQ